MTAGGTADVLQAVQSLPGATRMGEGSDIYTRGGDANETVLLLDGGRVLSLSRFETLSGSMFTALEPWVVKTVRYSSGGFSVRYLDGPKDGMAIHFFARNELGGLTERAFAPLQAPREQIIHRAPPEHGFWAQWEAIYRRR